MGFLSFSRPTAADGSSVEEQLAKLEIFSKLSEKQIRRLAGQFVPRRYAKGELIIKKDDTALGMFLIASGRVEVFDTKDGKRVPLATLEAGKSVGEMSLIDARPRSANVEALEDTECLLMTRDSFNGVTKRDPEVIWGIVPLLVQRLRHADSQLAHRSDVVEQQSVAAAAVTATTVTQGATVTVVTEAVATKVVEVSSSDKSSRTTSKRTAASTSSDDDDDDDDAEPSSDKPEGSKLFASVAQVSTASFMLMSSMLLLTTQESFRWLWSKDSVATSFDKNEEVVSSLTSKVEENMNDETKRLFGAFQELMNSIMGLFER